MSLQPLQQAQDKEEGINLDIKTAQADGEETTSVLSEAPALSTITSSSLTELGLAETLGTEPGDAMGIAAVSGYAFAEQPHAGGGSGQASQSPGIPPGGFVWTGPGIAFTDQAKTFIPRDDDGALTSMGSVLHFTGQCKPCVEFAIKAAGPVHGEPPSFGCLHGVTCRYCHFPHQLNRAQRRGRPSKAQRNAYRDFRILTKAKIAEDPINFDISKLELPDWLARNYTLKMKFTKGMQADHAIACVRAR